jgi:hypothetical protein
MSHVSRRRTCSVFRCPCLGAVRTFPTASRARGARRDRLAAAHGKCRAMMTLTGARRSSAGHRAGLPGGTLHAWAPPAALRPSGPRRRRRASHPRSPPHRPGAATISRHANCKSGHPPDAPVLSRSRSPSRARASLASFGWRYTPLWTVSFLGVELAPIRRMARTEHSLCTSRHPGSDDRGPVCARGFTVPGLVSRSSPRSSGHCSC